MHWLGPYVIRFVKNVGVFQLEKMNGEFVEGLVNNSQPKLYRDSLVSVH
jgi:hypothetical protein